ncbi:hypothetical protein [Yersinia enterocolitica]|uniref:hypothetical protein n=1 Tax=Yersinia enterocolitica TaxID=630 RepID=UPI003D79FEA9
MDIIELLALIGKKGAELTININSNKGMLDWIISLGPTFIAFAALYFSYLNMKSSEAMQKNSSNVQIEVAKLHAKTETASKLRYEWLNCVRDHCAEIAALSLTLVKLIEDLNDIRDKNEDSIQKAQEKLKRARELIVYGRELKLKLARERSILHMYLDSNDYDKLLMRINELYVIAGQYDGAHEKDYDKFCDAYNDMLDASRAIFGKEWDKICSTHSQ